MLDEAAVGGGEAQRHAAAGVAIDALVGEVQTRAVTLEQRPQRVPRKRLANVRPAPDFQNRRHGPSCYAAEIEAPQLREGWRGGPRVLPGGAGRGGFGGPFRGPPVSRRVTEEPPDSFGARRALGGLGGHFGAPHVRDA